MRSFLGYILICLSLGLGSLAHAEREVHVIAVGKGQPSNDIYGLPEAHVLVDRPGQDVGLVLLDGGDLSWRIETTDGTFVTDIIRSGPSPRDSEVILSGVPVYGVYVAGLPLVFNPWGQDFRTLVDNLALRFATTRLHSFHSAHRSRSVPLRVDRVDTFTAGLDVDYLSGRVEPSSDLPVPLQSWLATGVRDNGYVVDFGVTGISLKGPDGTTQFPVSHGVPDIFLPVSGVYAHDDKMIYGFSYGAEGYIYSVDVESAQWGVVTSLDGYDAARLLYDAQEHLLILTGAFSRPGDIRIIGLEGPRSSIFVPITQFVGLADLFDFGNEDGPPLTPRVYADDWLLLEALEGTSGFYPNGGAHRIYAVHLTSGEVRLLSYRNN